MLQIVLLYPETLNSIRDEISVKEITSAPLRQLWELCLELIDQQILPSVEQVLLRLEESELKSLAVWLDETGRQRSVGPDLLKRTLLAVQRRRVRETRPSTQDGPGATPDKLKINEPVDSKTLLRQVTEKHQRLHERRDAGH